MSLCVLAKVQSILVESSSLSQLNLGDELEAFYKILTKQDSIESLNIPIEFTGSRMITLRFNPLQYQLHIKSAHEQLKFQLYIQQANQKPPPQKPSAQFAFLISGIFGTDTEKTMNCNFDRTCSLQGQVQLELGLHFNADSFQSSFKKNTVNLAQLESRAEKVKDISSISRGSPKPRFNKRIRFNRNPNRPKRPKFGTKLDPNLSQVPEIIRSTIQCLEDNAMQLQGIFRESAPALDVETQVKKYESGKEMNWEQIENQHVVAGVLMNYFLQLPEPLIPFDLYDSFIAAEETVADRDERAMFIGKLLKTLPNGNRIILHHLLTFLNKLTNYSEVNKMTAHNLGIVFGPALLRKEVEDVKQMVADSPHVINSIKLLVEEYQFFFENGKLIGEAAFTEQQSNSKINNRLSSPPIKPHNEKPSINPSLHEKLMNDERELASFQEITETSIRLVERNMQLILTDLDDPKKFSPLDIQALNSLIYSFHALLDDPCVSSNELGKEVISSSIASNVATQCRTLKFAFRTVLDRLNAIEALVDTAALEGQRNYIEAIIVLAKTTERMKITFDKVQSSMLTKRGSSVDVHLSTVRNVILTISETIRTRSIQALKDELNKQNSVVGAVAIARLARVVIQALADESLEPLAEPIIKPKCTIATSETDKQRLQAVIEVMEHAFKEIERCIVKIQSRVNSIFSVIDSRPLVQLLVAVKKYINTYITRIPDDNSEVKQESTTTNEEPDGEDVVTARAEASRAFNEFRSLLNSVLIEVDSIASFKQAHGLNTLAEQLRMIAGIEDDVSQAPGTGTIRKTGRYRAADKRMSVGRVYVLKKMCTESFDDVRAYMFSINKQLSNSKNVAHLNTVASTLKQLNLVLSEYKHE